MSQTHHFGSGSFKKELWVASKKIFPKLTDVNVEFQSGQWEWIIADSAGNFVRSVNGGGGGWHGINLPSLGLHGDYSIGFRSASSDTKVIVQGDINYG